MARRKAGDITLDISRPGFNQLGAASVGGAGKVLRSDRYRIKIYPSGAQSKIHASRGAFYAALGFVDSGIDQNPLQSAILSARILARLCTHRQRWDEWGRAEAGQRGRFLLDRPSYRPNDSTALLVVGGIIIYTAKHGVGSEIRMVFDLLCS